MPDRLFIAPNGTVFFIEFKAPNGELSELQKLEHIRIESLGPVVFVLDSVEGGKFTIDMIYETDL